MSVPTLCRDGTRSLRWPMMEFTCSGTAWRKAFIAARSSAEHPAHVSRADVPQLCSIPSSASQARRKAASPSKASSRYTAQPAPSATAGTPLDAPSRRRFSLSIRRAFGPTYSTASTSRPSARRTMSTSRSASCSEGGKATANSLSAGSGSRRSSASTIMPSVPSLPTNRSTASMSGLRQYPALCLVAGRGRRGTRMTSRPRPGESSTSRPSRARTSPRRRRSTSPQASTTVTPSTHRRVGP